MQAYSDPGRDTDPHALPDLEVFYMSNQEIRDAGSDSCWYDDDGEPLDKGWYDWFCFPGCLPDSEPMGPFRSEETALADARDN